MFDGDSTVFIPTTPKEEDATVRVAQPKLYVFCGGDIAEYMLMGQQQMGRPTEKNVPAISIPDGHVSRRHGYFETVNANVTYVAQETANGIYLNGKNVPAGESVSLRDGDELHIPVGGDEADVVLVVAMSDERIHMWRSLANASRDELTGLPNRKAYTAWFQKRVLGGELDHSCLFILDIDKFKGINDTYGHEEGDHALVTLANHLKEAMATEFHAGRWGGDEFVGVIDAGADRAYEILSAMREKIAAHKVDDLFNMTISAGIVDIGKMKDTERNIHRMIEFADTALYEAKEGGRNCVHICN